MERTLSAKPDRPHVLPLLGILLCGALIAACYGFSLRLPFFFDDLPVMTWLDGRTLTDIWTRSSENAYYRPLTFTVYKLALRLPKGVQQVALHGANLLLHWLNAALTMLVVGLWSREAARAETAKAVTAQAVTTNHIAVTAKAVTTNLSPMLALAMYASALFSVFPFLSNAVPWVTAMPHLLVTTLTLVAVYAALRAGHSSRSTAWWVFSLGATALAPLAHESGIVCGAIVAGIVLILRGQRAEWRTTVWAAGSVVLSLAAIGLRTLVPGVESFNPDGLNSWYENLVFCLHGLVYPAGPLIGWLVREYGWHDLATVLGTAALLVALLAWLAVRDQKWRWMACALWWWACGMLPAAVRFRFGGLVNSPRFYALAAVGIVGLWVALIRALIEALSARLRPGWARVSVLAALGGAILVSNVLYLSAQRGVYLGLTHVYQQVLEAAAPAENAPLGFVNLPAWLAPKQQTYALAKEGVTVLPLYTNVREFIAVNAQARQADNVMFVHTLQELEDAYWGFHGDWPDWEQMRQFALDHRTVWLARYVDSQKRFVLHQAGWIEAAAARVTAGSGLLAAFVGGPAIAAVSAERLGDHHWAVAIDWQASGPVDAEVFLHVVDASGTLITQADGPALGGLVPMRLWQTGDRVHDVRHVYLPGKGPYTVLVGVYDASGRLPAYLHGARCADDAVPVATIGE